jgi:hypothetical protein
VRSGPEALGSASGYSVPSRQRLLWPHPSFSRRSGRLICFSPNGLCPRGPRRRRSLLLSANPSVRAAFRTPADRAVQDDCTSARVSLRPNARGSASAVVPLESVHVGCPNEAVKFARCCGPNSCLPFTDKDFYIRAFIPMSHLIRTSNMTTRVNRQSPAAGLTPAGSAALQAAPHSGHMPLVLPVRL